MSVLHLNIGAETTNEKEKITDSISMQWMMKVKNDLMVWKWQSHTSNVIDLTAFELSQLRFDFACRVCDTCSITMDHMKTLSIWMVCMQQKRSCSIPIPYGIFLFDCMHPRWVEIEKRIMTDKTIDFIDSSAQATNPSAMCHFKISLTEATNGETIFMPQKLSAYQWIHQQHL